MSFSEEIPDRGSADAATWLREQNVPFDTPTFWLVAALLAQYWNAALDRAAEIALAYREAQSETIASAILEEKRK